MACDADHSEICKFSAEGFKDVFEEIVAFVARAKKGKEGLAKPKTEPAPPLPFHDLPQTSQGESGRLPHLQMLPLSYELGAAPPLQHFEYSLTLRPPKVFLCA